MNDLERKPLEGYALVPVQPTPAMYAAAGEHVGIRAIWQAMLTAAPQAEAPSDPQPKGMPTNALAGAVCSVAEARGFVAFGAGVYRIQETQEPGLVVTFRRDGEQHYGVGDLAPEVDTTPIQADDIIARLQFTSVAGLDSLEHHLRSIRAQHWPETAPSPAPAGSPAAPVQQVGELTAEQRDAEEAPFEAWWEKHGQFQRAGGGAYEKTFAWHAWCAALSTRPELSDAEIDALRRDAHSLGYHEGCIDGINRNATQAAIDVLLERKRQVDVESWTPEHDDEHGHGEMSKAASAYAWGANYPRILGAGSPPDMWPWDEEWWKPGDPRRMLVKAAALILAEIERLDRAASSTPSQGTT